MEMFDSQQHLTAIPCNLCQWQARAAKVHQELHEVPVGAEIHDQGPKLGTLEGVVQSDNKRVPGRLQDVLLADDFVSDFLCLELGFVHGFHCELFPGVFQLDQHNLPKGPFAEGPHLLKVIKTHLLRLPFTSASLLLLLLHLLLEIEETKSAEAGGKNERRQATAGHVRVSLHPSVVLAQVVVFLQEHFLFRGFDLDERHILAHSIRNSRDFGSHRSVRNFQVGSLWSIHRSSHRPFLW
mmetsp:Transcript_34229/g.72913  ORF Transcript_34229/g.72913 Transcript_34229/m.72913 type:complete len:239 (+) Transcript_34229:897-1613(+)